MPTSGFAVRAVEQVEPAGLAGLADALPLDAVDLDVEDQRRRRAVVVPDVVVNHLVVPAVLALVEADRDHRGREQVQPRSAAGPRVGVRGREVDEAELGIERRSAPNGGATGLPLAEAPGGAAELAGGRARVEAPHALAGLRVVGGDVAAGAELAARHPDDHLAFGVQRGSGLRVALLPEDVRDLPLELAGRHVDRDDEAVELGAEDHPVADRDAAADPAAADRRDVLRDPRLVLPHDLAGLGVEGGDVVVPCRDVHDPLVDDRGRLLGVLRGAAGAEMRPPDALQLTDVRGVDLVQRRVPLVLDVPAVGEPVAPWKRAELVTRELGRGRDGRRGRPGHPGDVSVGGGATREQEPKR